MCEKEINSMHELARISIETRKYLQEYQDNIIESISQTLFEDKSNFSLLELQNPENQIQFIINIKRHFQWILDDCKYLNKDFQKYKDLDDFLNGEYRFFYENAINYINDSSNLTEKVENNLIEYFKKIIKLQ